MKGPNLFQRPTSSLDDVQPKKVPAAGQGGRTKPRKLPKVVKETASEDLQVLNDAEFGTVTLDLMKLIPSPKPKLATSVPSDLYREILKTTKITDFIAEALDSNLNDLGAVLEASTRLAESRKRGGSATISARVEPAMGAKVNRALALLLPSLPSVSTAEIVGGCVQLQAEERGLV